MEIRTRKLFTKNKNKVFPLEIGGSNLGVTNTGNGERGTGNRERESGNECTAVIRIRIQNGGRNHGKGSGNYF